MKTRTRRFKVVSYLVLLTMIVSLFGPMGTMKKVMADEYYPIYIYSGGQWYFQTISEESIVDNMQDMVHSEEASEMILQINEQPQNAFSSLGTETISIDEISLCTDPGSDYVIPANIKARVLTVCYAPSSEAKYTFIGNVGFLNMFGGRASLIGDVNSLELHALSQQDLSTGNKLEIKGDVTEATWNKRTEAIPESEYVPGYGEEEMKASIERCDSASGYETFFTGDLSLQGSIEKLNIKELFYDKELSRDFMITKKEISDYTTTSSMTPIIIGGKLSTEIPTEYVKAYSTSEWLGQHQDSKYKVFMVNYDKYSSYSWSAADYAGGVPVGTGQNLEVGEDHLPQNVDLSNAHIIIWGTAADGLILPEGVDLSALTIYAGKATVRGNVDKLDVMDMSGMFNFGFINVNVQGNVQFLNISTVRNTTSVSVDGTVSDGEIATGYSGDEKDSQICKISKESLSSSTIVDEGTIDKGVTLTTCNSDSEIKFTTGATYPELEEAAGITDANRIFDYNGMQSHRYVGMLFSQHTISADLVKSITDEAILDDGFQVTNQALNIKIKSFFMNYKYNDDKNITSTPTEIPFSIVIPDYKEDVEYGIVRVHDNGDGTTSYDVLDSDVAEGVISFASDKFSDFVLINNDIPAPADTTAPVLSAGSFNRTSHTEGTATFTSTEAGDFFYELVAKGEAEPEIDTDYDGEVCVAGSNSIVNPYGMEEGAMDLYVKVKDAAGNVSDAMKIEMAEYNSLPSFENSTVSINCSSTSSGLDITDFLAAIDDDNDQTLTWTMKQAPSHGKLTMTNATALSGGVNLIVDGSIVYQPDKNYCGTDQFVIQVSDGVATADCQVTMNVTDQTAPTATIKEGTKEWKSFLNTITFGLFFKNTLNVSIDAADEGGSGLKTVEYYKSATALTMEQIQNLANWTTYTSAFAISPVDKNQVIIYVKVTDKAGNISYVCTDGMEFDTVAPSISNNYQKDATSMEVTVADNGSGVNAVSYTVANGTAQTAVLTNGKFTIPSLEEGRYNVVVTATDKVGNISSQTIPVVSLYTVNFYDGELINLGPVKTEVVEYGNDATAPVLAKRNGFDFVGWSGSFTKVVSDIDVEALWNLTGVTVTPYVGTYDGKTHDMISIAGLNPSDVVTYSVDGEDYVTDCPSLTNVGSHSVYVKIDRDGLVTWISPEYTVTVKQKVITLAMISEIQAVEFNGEHFCPVPVVKDGTVTLKDGTDYTLSYTNNRNSGIAYVNVVGKGNYAGTVQAPFRILEKKSEVKVKDKETPEVSVPNLSKLYEDETIYTPEDRQIEKNGGSVKVELAVQTQVVSVPDQIKIKEMAKDKKIGLFLDISLFKVVQQAGQTSGSTSQISHTNQLLSIVIPIPNELKGRKGIELYRVHNGVPSIIPIGAENAIDGEYCTIDSENITLYVQNFSTYAIGYSTSSITSPKTGEESSQLPWILLGLGLAAAGVVVLKKSRRVRISK